MVILASALPKIGDASDNNLVVVIPSDSCGSCTMYATTNTPMITGIAIMTKYAFFMYYASDAGVIILPNCIDVFNV